MRKDKIDYVYRFYGENGVKMQKHWDFYCTARESARGNNEYRVFFFGGGVRGGKTFCVLITIIKICEEFPGMKAHIIRKNMSVLIDTTAESLSKLIKPGTYRKWNRDKSNYYVEFWNGSRIYLFAENIDKDKDLDGFKGLETNLIFLEQIEELSPKTFEKAKERAGSWRLKKEPKALIFSTFNPTHVKWVRESFYIPYKNGDLPKDYYAQFVLAIDNPYTTDEQFQRWETMDSRSYNQYILGDWEVLAKENVWAYGFKSTKHVVKNEVCKDKPIYLSFDFNVDPITCLAAHLSNEEGDTLYLHIFKEFRLRNSNIFELCNEIKKIYNGTYFIITGDASGKNRSVNLTDNITAYDIIEMELNIAMDNNDVPRRNLGHHDSRIVVNSCLEKIDIRIDPSCSYLIEDLETVAVGKDGKIDKSDAKKTHLFDCFRYFCNTYFHKHFYVKI